MKTFNEFIEQENDYIEIVITSRKEKGYPVSTTMKYRYKENGEWKYGVDLDSGEQDGAKNIPPKVAELLKQFGHSI